MKVKYDRFKHSEAVVQRCSVKKGVLRNLINFTGKHLCQSLFLIKLQAFVKFLTTAFFTEHFWWLLLKTKMKGLDRSVYYNALNTRSLILALKYVQDIVVYGRSFYSGRV